MLDIAIDVSDAEGVIDWRAVAGAGIKLALIKATEGSSFTSHMFAENNAMARAAGLMVVPYHFMSATSAAADQAKHFAEVAGLTTGSPYALDWEGEGAPPTAIVQKVGDALITLTGHSPLGYWGIPGSTPRGEAPTPEMLDWDRWVPRYVEPNAADFSDLSLVHQVAGPGARCRLWQYTERGRVPGAANAAGYVDRSVWMGTLDELVAWYGDTAPVPVPVPPPPVQPVGIKDAIEALQQALAAEGFYKAGIDGDPGPQTVAALAAWRSTLRGF